MVVQGASWSLVRTEAVCTDRPVRFWIDPRNKGHGWRKPASCARGTVEGLSTIRSGNRFGFLMSPPCVLAELTLYRSAFNWGVEGHKPQSCRNGALP